MIQGLMLAMMLQSAMPSATCAAVVAPPPELAGWTVAHAAVAGRTVAGATALELGRGVTATLPHTPEVTYPLRPEKPGGSVSYGGLFAFDVAAAGRYRVALGSAAWIDVVRDGAALESVAHGHGPDCTGIRKMVDFDLTPGHYVLQVAANGTATLPLMVVRAAK